MDYEQLHIQPFSKEECDMVKSTRIRVARNLAGYPLGTAVSKEQRLKI